MYVPNNHLAPYIVAGVAWAIRLYACFWLFRPVPSRPVFVRSNDFLKLVDLIGLTALCGSFFFTLVRPKFLSFNLSLAAGVAVVDVAFRLVVVEFEAWRLQGRSRKWSKRDARKHVRRRAATTSFH